MNQNNNNFKKQEERFLPFLAGAFLGGPLFGFGRGYGGFGRPYYGRPYGPYYGRPYGGYYGRPYGSYYGRPYGPYWRG